MISGQNNEILYININVRLKASRPQFSDFPKFLTCKYTKTLGSHLRYHNIIMNNIMWIVNIQKYIVDFIDIVKTITGIIESQNFYFIKNTE